MLALRLLVVSLLIAANTLFHVPLLLAVALVKALLPFQRVRVAINPLLTVRTTLLPFTRLSYPATRNRSTTTRVRPAASMTDTPEVAPAPISTRRLLRPLRVSAKSSATLGGVSVENTCGSATGPENFIVSSTLPPGSAV